MYMLKNLHDVSLKLPIILLVFFFTFINILLGHFFSYLSEVIGVNMEIDGPLFKSIQEEFLIAVVFAPIGETFIHQYLVFIILDYFKLNKKLIIIISATTFAAIHVYSWLYVIATFTTGLLFGYLYWVSQIRNQKPFLVVLAVHALYNLYAFLGKNGYFSFVL